MERVSNWGRYPKIQTNIIEERNYNELCHIVSNSKDVIARGNGRCYGDSSLNENLIISTLKLNKILFFDTKEKKIKAEAGVTIKEILEVIVPKGFFLPITPGTKYVTLGGAVASNIHGKNHHKDGAFGEYVENIEIINENGEIIQCSRILNKELFSKSIGGMGLTGVIITITLKLIRIETAYIKQKAIKINGMDQLFDKLEEYGKYTYSVAWIDCASSSNKSRKSLLLLGEHVFLEELPINNKNNPLKVHKNKSINIPFSLPSMILNKYSVKIFNYLYYNKNLRRNSLSLLHYDDFFYPLDKINNWNRVYGRNGFTQFQFIMPFANGKAGIKDILNEIARSSSISTLGILKIMGDASEYCSPISFPKPGYTFALDFKLNKKNFYLINSLHKIVLENKGNIYLTKDALIEKTDYEKMYDKGFYHPMKFRSCQSVRLSI